MSDHLPEPRPHLLRHRPVCPHHRDRTKDPPPRPCPVLHTLQLDRHHRRVLALFSFVDGPSDRGRRLGGVPRGAADEAPVLGRRKDGRVSYPMADVIADGPAEAGVGVVVGSDVGSGVAEVEEVGAVEDRAEEGGRVQESEDGRWRVRDRESAAATGGVRSRSHDDADNLMM